MRRPMLSPLSMIGPTRAGRIDSSFAPEKCVGIWQLKSSLLAQRIHLFGTHTHTYTVAMAAIDSRKAFTAVPPPTLSGANWIRVCRIMLGLNDNAGDYIDSFTALQQADNFRVKPLSGD